MAKTQALPPTCQTQPVNLFRLKCVFSRASILTRFSPVEGVKACDWGPLLSFSGTNTTTGKDGFVVLTPRLDMRIHNDVVQTLTLTLTAKSGTVIHKYYWWGQQAILTAQTQLPSTPSWLCRVIRFVDGNCNLISGRVFQHWRGGMLRIQWCEAKPMCVWLTKTKRADELKKKNCPRQRRTRVKLARIRGSSASYSGVDLKMTARTSSLQPSAGTSNSY
jgi:hypothetical protein